MRSVVLSAAAAAILFAAPAFARSNQSPPPSAGQTSNDEGASGRSSGNGASKGSGLFNSSLFGVGIALAATTVMFSAYVLGGPVEKRHRRRRPSVPDDLQERFGSVVL